MKIKMLVLSCFLSLSALADTNILQLVWTQPPNYSSTLYTATNLDGTWSPLIIPSNQPPVSITATQSTAFFYVVVTPNNNLAGPSNPTNDAIAGATYVNTNTGDFWLNQFGGTNGWIEEIAGE